MVDILDTFLVECLIDTRVQEVDQDMTNACVYIYKMDFACPGITTWDILQSLQQSFGEIVLLVVRAKE
jgi:hypothetical protein